MKKRFLGAIFFFWLGTIACTSVSRAPENVSLVNFAHLEHLTRQVVLGGDTVALVLIYAEYPDYQPVEAPGEGIACVDDAARAAVLYLRQFRYNGKTHYRQRAKKLLKFLLQMQAANGRFYNFVYRDLQINRTRHNSQPKPDWWSWRTFWAFSEALPIFSEYDSAFANRLEKSLQRFLPTVDSLAALFPRKDTTDGFVSPAWLPYGAADQGSVILLGLNRYLQYQQDARRKNYPALFARGLLTLQQGDSTHFPYGAFLSWRNIWHAWGNSQAASLVETAGFEKNPDFLRAALLEIKYFYPFLQKKGYLRQMEFRKNDGQVILQKEQRFEQIAYDIRPLVMACLEAYRATGEAAYARQAGQIACWLLGANVTGKALYDPTTGRCYDGIINEKQINLNSGAESTIEALLTLQAVEQNPIARKVVAEFISSRTEKK